MALGFKLLTPGNPKTVKGQKKGYWTFILHLAPAKLSGFMGYPVVNGDVATGLMHPSCEAAEAEVAQLNTKGE